MKKTGFVFVSLLLLVTAFAEASVRDIGNGGNVVVCYNSKKKITSIELFDYYEARTKRNIQIDLGAPSLSVDEKVKLIFSRLRRLNPNRERLYLKWYSEFYKDAAIIDGVELIPLPDVGVGVIPKNCEIKQVAGQQEPTFPGDSRYVINGDLWKLMNNDSKAGLIAHEIVLREAIMKPNDHTTSIATRYFHSQLASHNLDSLTLRQYAELMLLIKFRSMDAGTMVMGLGAGLPKFYNDNFIAESSQTDRAADYWKGVTLPYLFQGQELDIWENSPQFYPNGQVTYIANSSVSGKTFAFKDKLIRGEFPSAALSFYEGGSFRGISLERFGQIPQTGLLRGLGFNVRFKAVTLYPSGHIENLSYADGTLKYRGELLTLTQGSTLQFFRNSSLHFITVTSPMTVSASPTLSFKAIDGIVFYENGFVERATVHTPFTWNLFGHDVAINGSVEFFDNNQFYHGDLANPVSLNFPTQTIHIKEDLWMETTSARSIAAQDMTLKNARGFDRTYRTGDRITFDNNGHVIP